MPPSCREEEPCLVTRVAKGAEGPFYFSLDEFAFRSNTHITLIVGNEKLKIRVVLPPTLHSLIKEETDSWVFPILSLQHKGLLLF